MRSCTTHHHACDCREEKFRKMEAALAEARKGLEFYASGFVNNDVEIVETRAIFHGSPLRKRDGHVEGELVGTIEKSGKTARAALSKIEELLKTNQNT